MYKAHNRPGDKKRALGGKEKGAATKKSYDNSRHGSQRGDHSVRSEGRGSSPEGEDFWPVGTAKSRRWQRTSPTTLPRRSATKDISHSFW